MNSGLEQSFLWQTQPSYLAEYARFARHQGCICRTIAGALIGCLCKAAGLFAPLGRTPIMMLGSCILGFSDRRLLLSGSSVRLVLAICVVFSRLKCTGRPGVHFLEAVTAQCLAETLWRGVSTRYKEFDLQEPGRPVFTVLRITVHASIRNVIILCWCVSRGRALLRCWPLSSEMTDRRSTLIAPIKRPACVY